MQYPDILQDFSGKFCVKKTNLSCILSLKRLRVPRMSLEFDFINSQKFSCYLPEIKVYCTQ